MHEKQKNYYFPIAFASYDARSQVPRLNNHFSSV